MSAFYLEDWACGTHVEYPPDLAGNSAVDSCTRAIEFESEISIHGFEGSSKPGLDKSSVGMGSDSAVVVVDWKVLVVSSASAVVTEVPSVVVVSPTAVVAGVSAAVVESSTVVAMAVSSLVVPSAVVVVLAAPAVEDRVVRSAVVVAVSSYGNAKVTSDDVTGDSKIVEPSCSEVIVEDLPSTITDVDSIFEMVVKGASVTAVDCPNELGPMMESDRGLQGPASTPKKARTIVAPKLLKPAIIKFPIVTIGVRRKGQVL